MRLFFGSQRGRICAFLFGCTFCHCLQFVKNVKNCYLQRLSPDSLPGCGATVECTQSKSFPISILPLRLARNMQFSNFHFSLFALSISILLVYADSTGKRWWLSDFNSTQFDNEKKKRAKWNAISWKLKIKTERKCFHALFWMSFCLDLNFGSLYFASVFECNCGA